MTWRGLPLGKIRVRKLIDEQDRRPAPQCRVEVKFLTNDAAVMRGQRRHSLESLEEALSLHSTAEIDVASNDAASRRSCPARGLADGIGLANTGREAEENTQPTALRALLLVLNVPQELIGIGPHFC